MSRSAGILAAACSALWLQMAAPAGAQNWASYNAPLYMPSVVSPYLNLGVNQNGLSNYQSLVRPMIEEQESLQRQSANLQRLQRQIRDSQRKQDPLDPTGANGRSQSAVRFMHYSHYYNKQPTQGGRSGGWQANLPFPAGP